MASRVRIDDDGLMTRFVVVGLILFPAVAGADDVAAPPSSVPPVTAPASTAPAPEASPFVTMFPQDGTTKVDIDAAYLFVKNNGGDTSTTVFRGDLFAQYVDPHSGLGGYATIPFTHSSGDGMSVNSLGGLEVGGVFVRRLEEQSTSIVVHAGLVLPTVSTDETSLVGLVSAVTRLPELYATIPDAVTLRIGISPIFRSGPLFVRLDANFDANLSAQNETEKPGFELDAGIGYDAGKVVVMAEVTNVILTGDNDSVTLDVAALSARVDLGKVKPYAALTIPLDDDTRQIMNAAITVGLSATP